MAYEVTPSIDDDASPVKSRKETAQARGAGLSSDEAGARLRRYGPNRLPKQPQPSELARFLKQFANPLVVTLLIAAAVAVLVAVRAGARLLWRADLPVEEAALTGESVPVTKEAKDSAEEAAQLGAGQVFLGTTVVRGKGRAVVTGSRRDRKGRGTPGLPASIRKKERWFSMKRAIVNAGTLVLIGLGTLGLASCGSDKAAPSGEQAGHAGHPPDRQLSVTVDGQGFHPASLTAPANEHVRVTFKRTSDEGCAKQVVFPSSNVRRDLPLSQPVDVDVHMPASGSLTFQCEMGMLKGSITVQ